MDSFFFLDLCKHVASPPRPRPPAAPAPPRMARKHWHSAALSGTGGTPHDSSSLEVYATTMVCLARHLCLEKENDLASKKEAGSGMQ